MAAKHATLRREHVLAYLNRDWAAAARRKGAHWVERVREGGALVGLRAAEALSEHVAAFTREEEAARRARDLDELVALKRRIDAASARLRR